MSQMPSRARSFPASFVRRAFTLTEMLVVIGIIALLIGILLPALGRVQQKARQTESENLMQEFGKACENFQQQFGFYPGIVPEAILAGDPKISGLENAVLHLCGGAIAGDDPNYNASTYSAWTEINFNSPAGTFNIKVNPAKVGEGPRIRGTQYKSFFSPKASDLVVVKGQGVGGSPDVDMDPYKLPDLVDAWGQPMLYFRQMRENGSSLMKGAQAGDTLNDAVFAYGGAKPYVESLGLGELSQSQADSIFVAAPVARRNSTFAQVLRSVSYGKMGATATPGFTDAPNQGAKRGAIAILSAGPDGVYFSKYDGLGTRAIPRVDIVLDTENAKGPYIADEYDDLRVFTGG